MSLVEFSVDRIDVQTVPKFVLFGGDEVSASEAAGTAAPEEESGELPVSVGTILLVSIGATLLAFAAAKAASMVDTDLNLHC